MRLWGSGLLRRVGWTVGDQALTSVGNLALAVAVARAVPVRDFGAFALAFALYLFLLGISRAVATDPLVIRYSTGDVGDRSQATRAAVGAASVVATAMGVLTMATALLLDGSTRSALLTLGAVLPALLVQDAWRFAFFAAGVPRRAAVNDSIRIALMLMLVGVVGANDVSSASVFIGAWGAAAGAAALLGCVQTRSLPLPAALPAWWRAHKSLAKDFVGEHVALSGAGAFSTVIVAGVAGLGAAAALRGAHVVFGVVNLFLQSGVALAVPEGRRLRERSVDRLVLGLRLGSVGLVALPLLLLVPLLLIPDDIGEGLLGDTWGPASSVFPAYALYMAATGATLGASIGLRVLERSRAALIIRLQILPVSLVGAFLGAAWAGATGVALSMAAVTGLGAVLWWRALAGAVRQDRAAGADHRPS